MPAMNPYLETPDRSGRFSRHTERDSRLPSIYAIVALLLRHRRRLSLPAPGGSFCAMPTTPSLPPLIGRSHELARLESALAGAEGGKSLTLFLAGEGGVGKTRLARAAAVAAERRGFAVAEGRAYSVESGVPYAVFADALAPTLRRLDQSALTVVTRGAAGE